MVRTYKRKPSRNETWTETSMQKAIDAINNKIMGYQKASKFFQVPKTTLIRKVKTQNSSKRLGRFKQVFNEDQEKVLLGHIIDFEKRFFGLTTRDVRSVAFQLAEANNLEHKFDKKTGLAGRDWLFNFQKRHPDISLRNPEQTSKARAQAFNRPIITAFFTMYKEMYDEKKFHSKRIFNVDETGITTVQTKSSKIFALKGRKQVGTLTSAERGVLSTAVICASASGYYVPPMIIFPRKRMKPELMDGTPPGAPFACHESGWMQTEIFTNWFRHFIRFTKPTPDDPCLLILDGHVTHTKNVKFLEMAVANNVTVLCVPPHCTHRLQPLDVSFMGPLNNYFSQSCEKFLRNNPGRVVTQFQIGGLFGEAYLKAATPINIISGFRKTGLYPVDPNVFGDEDFIAAEVTDITLSPEHVVGVSPTNNVTSKHMHIVPDIPTNTSAAIPRIPPLISIPSTFGVVSPRVIQPLPKVSATASLRKNRRAKGKAAILTSSPYKRQLEESLINTPKTTKYKSNKKTKPKREKMSKPKSETDTDDNDCPCLYCNRQYSNSKKGDGWIQCCTCKKWAHENCAGCEEEDEFFFCSKCKF